LETYYLNERNQMNRSKSTGAIAYCKECGKLSYTDRKRARVVARQHHPSKGTYKCPVIEGLYHVGSLALPVKQGIVTRNEFYGEADDPLL
jgi:hypothetical protein